MQRPVLVTHTSFTEGWHMTKNTACGYWPNPQILDLAEVYCVKIYTSEHDFVILLNVLAKKLISIIGKGPTQKIFLRT